MKFTRKCVLVPFEKYERLVSGGREDNEGTGLVQNSDDHEDGTRDRKRKRQYVETKRGVSEHIPHAPPPGLPDVIKPERKLEPPQFLQEENVSEHKLPQHASNSWKSLWLPMNT